MGVVHSYHLHQQKLLISSLMDSPGHIKVSFYVLFCIAFIFCIACESCLFVITNS